MPYNGTTGTYTAPSLPGSWNPATAGSTASPSDWNTLLADFVTAYTTAICKDGQTTPTANLPMGGFKHTGVGNAAARDSYASAGQVQDNSLKYVAAGGTADAITLTLVPAVTAYVVGQTFYFKAGSDNATTTPTINVNGVGAGTITWPDGSALRAGDIKANGLFAVSVQATTPVFHLQTVASPPATASSTTTFTNKTFQVDATGNVFYAPLVPQGRLSLATATPVMTSAQTAKTTIYYCLYTGNLVPIYDGTQFKWTVFAELTNDLTASAVGKAGPAAATTNSNYDLFVWNDSGTVRLTRGPLWTSDTARGTGAGTTELQRVNGVWTNKVAITNGPGANAGTYVGTIRTDGSSQANWQPGAVALNGTAALLNVWNAYNRIECGGLVGDTTDSWNYTTATWRSANASATMRVSFVQGLQEDFITGEYRSVVANGVSPSVASCGIGYDVTNAVSGRNVVATAQNGVYSSLSGDYQIQSLGFHFMQAVEYSTAAGTTSWYGDAGGNPVTQTGLTYKGRF